MLRTEITDQQWALIEHLFPEPKKTGRPPRDRRVIFEAIVWVRRTGAPWRDLPDAFGPWQSAWRLFNDWTNNGILDKILRTLQAHGFGIGAIDDELWCVDGTVVRAARCAAGARKKRAPRTASPRTRLSAVAEAGSGRRSNCCATAPVTRSTSD